jgi:beta,beta-carotene 9',10'-dioxygenase
VKTDSPSNAHKNDDEAFENTKVVGEIPITDPMYPGYYHSFGMTKNFMILFELPLRINVMTLSANATRPVCLTDAFEWHDKPTRIHVFNWQNGENVPIMFDYDPCFIFHHANAYEKDGCLVVDFNKMVTADILNTLDVNRMRANGFHTKSDKERGYLHRVIIPLSIPSGAKPGSDLLQNISFAGKCKAVVGEDGKSVRLVDERLSPETFGFPRYNYAYNAKPYRYCYGATIQPHDDSLTGLVKCDLEKKSTSTWNRDHAEQVCAEPVFVAKPDAKSEDNGVILCPIITTRKSERAFVLVLDGSTFKEIARCHVEQPLPLSFHSMCFSNKSNK